MISGGWKGGSIRDRIHGVDVRRLWTPFGPHLLQLAKISFLRRQDIVVDDLAHAVPWGSPVLRSGPGIAVFHHLHARTLRGQVGPTTAKVLGAFEWLYPTIYRNWEFVTESERSAEDLVMLGVNRERTHRIPPGVDRDLFRPGQKSASPTLVYFGGMRRYKRPVDAIAVLASVRRRYPEVKMEFIGDGLGLSSAKSAARIAGVIESIRFHGRLPDEALASILSRSWVNLVTSEAEGWCFCASEATASGVPTVAYDVPGLQESVEHDHTGKLVPLADEDAFSAAVCEILANPKNWWNNCLEARTELNWDRTVDAWSDLVQRLAGVEKV